ncbi:MAG: hypothetical protein MR766_01675 [Erysipelotrichaceae bacterium]|nr:hypothetical protein [Erysipelotrichaceae bacterium]
MKEKIEKRQENFKAPIKLEMLVTVVNRPKADFFVDLLEQFGINMQMVTYGEGTASSELINSLGLSTQKAVIFSIVRSDKINKIKETLEEKFKTIRNGKGISFTIPLSSVIGASIYQFMCNQNKKKEAK